VARARTRARLCASVPRVKGITDWLWRRGGAIALAVLVLYVWQAPGHVVDGDNAEFTTIGATGGVPHPSGYPLYALWLRLWSVLPLGGAAHTAAIATAVLGAAGALTLHAAARAWGARSLAAGVAVALVALSPTVWRTYTEAEVFALAGLVAATVLWLAAPAGPARGVRRAGLLALVAGLGLANHVTCVLLAPVGLYGIWLGWRETDTRRWRVLVLSPALLVLGLTPYLYLMVAPFTAISWREIHSLGDLLHHFLRLDYGEVGTFATMAHPAPMATRLLTLGDTLGRGVVWAPLLLAVVAFAVRLRDRATRWAWTWLLLSFALAGPILASRFALEHDPIGLYVVRRFHLLPLTILAIPIAVGLELALRRLRAATPGAPERAAPAVLVPLLAMVLAASLSLRSVAAAHSPALERSMTNIMKSLPPGAVLVGRSDALVFVGAYAQEVLGVRRDLALVPWSRMKMPGQSQRYRAALGFDVPDGPEPLPMRIVRAALAHERPVFVEYSESAVLANFRYTPFGMVARVPPQAERLPGAAEAVALNRAIYEAYDLAYQPPSIDDDIPMMIHKQYQAVWLTIRDQLAANGQHELAGEAHALAEAVAPRGAPPR
jgi:hypothetical protein